MAKPPNEEEKTWLKLPGMKSGPLIYDKETGHVYTFPDFKCADSQLFATKIHSSRCGYFNERVEPASHCTAIWKKGDGHYKGHGPPGRIEMELMAFWWQVVLYMLAKHKNKSGQDVVDIVYQEWPFTMKKIFVPIELATIMRSTLARYKKLADAGPQSSEGMKRAIFLKSHYQIALDTFISELKKTKDWWGPFEEGGTPRLCCNIQVVSTREPEAEDPLARNSSPMSDGTLDREITSDRDLTAEVDQFEQSVDPESLTGVKLMLEAVRLEAERRGKEADQLRRALAYLNYSIVTDGSELTQERIDEIIKIGEMAEREGIEPGYLISSSTESTDESPEKVPVASAFRMNLLADSNNDTLQFPLYTSRPVIIAGRPSNINGTPVVVTATGELIQSRIDRGEISQTVKQVRFAEELAKTSEKIGSENEMDVYAVPLTKSTAEPSSTFERFVFGQADGQVERRTVLVLGADGSGQTRFINGIINFVFDVEPSDKFRFQLIDEQADAGRPDCIHVYDIHHARGFRVPYSLTIIDTPSYGTRNAENLELFRDEKTVKLFLEFFRDEAAIKELDMICYVIMEAGVFNSALSIFSNDVKENINCWQPSDYLGDTSKWQQIPRRFVSVLSKMTPKSMALTQQVLEVMERLKESMGSLQPIFRIRSAKIKEMENAKLTVATCEAQIKANEEKWADGQKTEDIEIKWTCLLSGAQDLLACLQLDLDMNKNEMLEHFVTALRCVQQLKKNSRRNPFITQKLCDFLYEIEQQLKLCPTDDQS